MTDRVYDRLAHHLGPVVRPLHWLHRGATQHAYFWVHAGLQAAALTARAVSAARADDVGSLTDHPRRHGAVAVLNGFRGDRLALERSALALPMTLRHRGRDVPVDARGVLTAYGRGHTRLVVFVHGLVETEDAWLFRARERWGRDGVSYGSRLQAQQGYLPLWVRYNTGRSIAGNAAALASLLQRLALVWPQPVEELVLVGHSMGGLVILDALAHHSPSAALPVRAAVTLGSPRAGAPLARAADTVERLAGTRAQATWLAGLVGLRGEGIRDLRGERPAHRPVPASVGQLAVLSTLTPDPTWAVGSRIGDGLVPVPARHQTQTAVLGGLHHLDLLNHPRVYDQVTDWLADLPGCDPSGAAAPHAE